MNIKNLLCLCALFFTEQACAYDGMTSQIPHALGGALLAGLITKSSDESEHRALIGFSASTALVVAVEGSQLGTGSRRHSQLLDISYHALGSAIGAWTTDKFILSPVIAPTYIGLMYIGKF